MAAPRKENVKNIIIEATERLIEKKTLASVSLAEIAQESGVSKGTLYYHYKNKDQILFDITDKYLTQQWNDLIEWTENPEKDTSLHRLVKYVVERNIASSNIRMHLYYDAFLGNEEIRINLLKRFQEFDDIISQKISERTDTLNANFLTKLILLTSDGLFVQKVLKNESFDIEQFIKDGASLVRFFTSGNFNIPN